jgi:hypothetical protein
MMGGGGVSEWPKTPKARRTKTHAKKKCGSRFGDGQDQVRISEWRAARTSMMRIRECMTCSVVKAKVSCAYHCDEGQGVTGTCCGEGQLVSCAYLCDESQEVAHAASQSPSSS